MWIEPKTDWNGEVVEGVYQGDRFNASDFNRIKNNLDYLRDMALRLYKDFTIKNIGADKTPMDYFYADEINGLEENLRTISTKSVNKDYGVAPVFMDNGHTPTFKELNDLEKNILDLHDALMNQLEGLRSFTWNFGSREGGI